MKKNLLNAVLKRLPRSRIFEEGMERNAANYRPLTPLDFLSWAATVYPEWPAVIYGETKRNYADLYERCCRLAGALVAHDIRAGDCVAVIASNIPEMLEAHFAVPMTGAVINPINPNRNVSTLAYILDHSEARAVLVEEASLPLLREALGGMELAPKVIVITDKNNKSPQPSFVYPTYEAFLGEGSANFAWPGPEDEWQAISVCYTQGTQGKPKGVVYHHRGAYLDATGDVISSAMHHNSVYLWTMPMSRSHGCGHVWAMTAVAGTHICLRDATDRSEIMDLIRRHQVTHLSGAYGFLDVLAGEGVEKEAPLEWSVQLEIIGAPANQTLVKRVESLGFKVTFLYGMTECYGVAGICAWKEEGSSIGKPGEPALLAHSSAHYPTLDEIMVVHPETLERLPADGKSEGEIVMRGNSITKGYLKDPESSKKAFREGWFHTGDIGILHPDGHIEITARKKEVISHDPALAEKA